MDKAFEIILKQLFEELQKQGFSEPEEMEDELGTAYFFKTEEVAYQVVYDEKKQVFLLRSNAYTEDGSFAHDWKQLSMWLFDKAEGTPEDASSIANDFVDVVMGSKRVAAVKSAKRKKKKSGDDENNIDCIFFYNRLVGFFPELKEEMNQEKIKYGQVRVALFAKEHVAPKIQKMALECTNVNQLSKLKTLIGDMYVNGDPDLRAVITAGVLNNISDQTAIAKISEDFPDALAKVYKCSRKLIGKNIKPEKVKKQSKIVARALDNAAHK